MCSSSGVLTLRSISIGTSKEFIFTGHNYSATLNLNKSSGAKILFPADYDNDFFRTFAKIG